MTNIKGTNRTAELANAREVDTRIAAEWAKAYDVLDIIRVNEKSIREAAKSLKFRHVGNDPRLVKHYEARIESLEKTNQGLRNEFNELAAEAQLINNAEYEGWSRFYLVQHIHNTTACSSFRLRTRINWLPAVSGLTEFEAVAQYGATLCTLCFPSAPTELTTAKADDTICTGSRDYEAPSRSGYVSGNWGTCTCGQRVTLTSAGNLRKHKKA